MNRPRCEWPSNDERMIRYHDLEWGVPLHDDARLFEAFSLGGAQAGLSWRTILHRREGYRRAFHGFDPERVARMGPEDVKRLMGDEGIIRNRLKIESVIHNAKRVLEAREAFGSLDAILWRFTEGETVHNRWTTLKELPATSPISDAMCKDLRKRGFKFAGSTICYAFMQAVGMVNDHVVGCFRHAELGGVPEASRPAKPRARKGAPRT